MAGNLTYACPVCGTGAPLLDVVDVSKSCEEARGKYLPLEGVPVYYALCDDCGFCFAPDMARWSLDEFAARIYNEEYYLVDPDYREARPIANARMIASIFGAHALHIRHLDYGGGNGELSAALFGAGFDSQSYDPFVDGPLSAEIGRFNLVTCFEVFEHVPDVNDLMRTLVSLLDDRAVVLFSTLTSDGHIARGQRLTWWYASPRNGHISLFSRKSLALAGASVGFTIASVSPLLHMFWRQLPPWADGLLAPPSQA